MAGTSEVLLERASDSFPPRELWRYDARKEGKLEVVYDVYGLVDMEASVALLMQTVEPGFDFASGYSDLHHLQHNRQDYRFLQRTEWLNPMQFRNLPRNQIESTRMFHEWWHRTFDVPRTPGRYAMKLAVDAQKPLMDMKSSMKYALELAMEAEPNKQKKEHHYQLQLRMGYFAYLLDQLHDVPKEFQLVSVDDLEVNSTDDMLRIAGMMTQYIIPRRPIPIVLKDNWL